MQPLNNEQKIEKVDTKFSSRNISINLVYCAVFLQILSSAALNATKAAKLNV